ncbi:DNA-binding IclR family transcriptional regulator [Paraburkholderia sp. GAS334]
MRDLAQYLLGGNDLNATKKKTSLASVVEPATATTGTVSRAVQLLTLLADSPGTMAVKQVAEQMQLAPSTAHRLLQLLRKEGFVEAAAEGHKYSIGPQFYRVAARVMSLVRAPDIALPMIQEVADTFDEAVVFGLYLPEQGAVSFVARADGKQMLKYQIDMFEPLSLVWGASGKAILAYLPTDVVQTVLANEGPSPACGAALPSRRALTAELNTIRAQGYAVSTGEKLPDARGIAAPVFGPRGILGCICLTSPKSRLPHGNIEAIGREVARRATTLSRALGASGDMTG